MKTSNIQTIKSDKSLKNKVSEKEVLKNLPDHILDNINVDVQISAGNLKMNINQLLKLKKNDVLKLDRLTSDPVDLILDKEVIAQAELVAEQDYLGIKIIHILK